MQKHSSPIRGTENSANKSLWPDCEIEVDPYRLPVHIEFEVPNPVFSQVAVNRTVSIYNSFVVISDKMGGHATTLRIIALADFDAVVVRVGFSTPGYRQIGSAVYLHHEKLGLELPLYTATDCQDTAVFWLSWSRVLGVPAMTIGQDGSLADPFDRLGKLLVGRPLCRRSIAGEIDSYPTYRRQSCHHQRRMAGNYKPAATANPSVADQKNGSNVYRLFS